MSIYIHKSHNVNVIIYHTVGKHGSEQVVTKYVKEQGKEKEYVKIHKDQLKLF